ncbi:MAG: hypothetical protein HYV90_00035 [Candidatus Woesebacteria bacterium]|nr:MAG: hypothetical protein HYV90_00035 [Candidatus Woesebacteria bacterium]
MADIIKEVGGEIPWDKGLLEAMEGKVAEEMEGLDHSFRWLTDQEKDQILQAGESLPKDLPTRRWFARTVVMELRTKSPLSSDKFDRLLEEKLAGALAAKQRYSR